MVNMQLDHEYSQEESERQEDAPALPGGPLHPGVGSHLDTTPADNFSETQVEHVHVATHCFCGQRVHFQTSPTFQVKCDSQREKCARGEHECGVVLSGSVPVFGADTDILGHTVLVKYCRQCRCLYVEKA